ncbi:TolC family protein [Paracoccaceae bacterium]|nr:TolC family protein [Paracoccaceae bacterium]
MAKQHSKRARTIALSVCAILTTHFLSACMSSKLPSSKIDQQTLTATLTSLANESNNEIPLPTRDAGTMEYLRFAVAHDPEIAALQQAENAARSNVQAAKSKLLPQINATSTVGGYQADIFNGRVKEGAAVSLTLSQLLYDGGLTEGGINTAQLKLALAKAAIEEAVNRKSAEAANAGLALALASREFAAIQKFQDEIKPHLAQLKLMAKSGLIDRSILDEINGRVIELDLVEEEAKTAMRIAQISFKKYFNNLTMPTTDFTLPKSLTDELTKSETLYGTPLANRAALNVLIAEIDLKIAKSALAPKVNAQVRSSSPMDPSENTNAQAGIMLTYQVSDGGSRKANILSVADKLKQTRQTADLTIKNAEQSLALLKEKRRKLESWIKLSNKKLSTFLSRLEVAEKQIQTGQADIRKVFEIKFKVNEIKGKILRTRTELSKTHIEIAAALGAFSN